MFTGLILFFIGCKIGSKKVFKETYYKSGKLMSKGWFIKDTIPVDAMFYFYENGNIEQIEERNDSGFLNGETKFYNKDGKIYGLTNYVKGVMQGFEYEYKDGALYTKNFFLNDTQMGDVFGFDKKSKINYYGFLDFDEHNRDLQKYDSTGNLIKDLRPIIFVDSIRPYVDSPEKENERSYDILLLVSNPPHCQSRIKIDYVSINGTLIKSDSIIHKEYFFKKEKFVDSLFAIKIGGSQYDSLDNKTTYQEHNAKLIYEK